LRIEPEATLLCSQGCATGSYTEPAESTRFVSSRLWLHVPTSCCFWRNLFCLYAG